MDNRSLNYNSFYDLEIQSESSVNIDGDLYWNMPNSKTKI